MRSLIATIATACAIALPAAAQMKPSANLPPTTNNPNIQITPTQNLPLEAARRITREDAIKMVKEKKAVYVDVRPKEAYDAGHIKGALSIPEGEIMTRLKEIPAHKFIITYCA